MEIFIAVVAVLLIGAVVLVVRTRRRPRSTDGPAPRSTEEALPAPRGEGLGSRVRALFERGDVDAWAELEDLLIRADVGPVASADLVARSRASRRDGEDPVEVLRREMLQILGPDDPLRLPEGRLGVILIVGVNGSGKTTTIGKLAGRLASDGARVSVAGADTFRAAADAQLEVWSERAGVHLVSQQRGADPGAVAFDAVTSAIARGSDVLIIDTAGRLHTKQPLMDELAKIRRVIEKAGATADETLLVLDAQTGQNGIAQARAFTEAVPLTGVVLTKTDGSARGGIMLAVREELGIAIRFVGTGEAIGDLRPFEARAFTDRLLGT